MMTVDKPRTGSPPCPKPLRDLIMREYRNDPNLSRISRQLTEDGIPTARGGRWYPATVLGIIRWTIANDPDWNDAL